MSFPSQLSQAALVAAPSGTPPEGTGHRTPAPESTGQPGPQLEGLGLLAGATGDGFAQPSPALASQSSRMLVEASPFWRALQGRPDALVDVLSHAYDGPRCQHSGAYEALCASLRAASADPATATRCLKEMLLEALFASSLAGHRDAAHFAQAFADLQAALDTGRMPYDDFKAAMRGTLVKLRPVAASLVVSSGRGRAFERLGELGVNGHALAPPGDLPDHPGHLEWLALRQVLELQRVCGKSADLSPAELRADAHDTVVNMFGTLPVEAWGNFPGGAPMPPEELLRMVRRAAWLVARTTEGAIGEAILSPAHRQAALEGARQGIEYWLDGGLRGDRGRALAEAWPGNMDIMMGWSQSLMRWRMGGDERDELLDQDDGLACANVRYLLARQAARGDRTQAVPRLRAAEAALSRAFRCCLDNYAIEDCDRELLAGVCRAQVHEAAQEALNAAVRQWEAAP